LSEARRRRGNSRTETFKIAATEIQHVRQE